MQRMISLPPFEGAVEADGHYAFTDDVVVLGGSDRGGNLLVAD